MGSDLFLDTLFLNASEALDWTDEIAYQPARVFILGRSFSGSDAWLASQREKDSKTSRPSVFFFAGESKDAGIWADLTPTILPPMSHPEFTMAFRTALADKGYNEVLVEVGSGFSKALFPGLSGRDRVYLLKSKAQITGDVSLPPSYQDLHFHAEYESDSDFLSVASGEPGTSK